MKEKIEIKNAIKLLKSFMNLNRQQQLEVISKLEKKSKKER